MTELKFDRERFLRGEMPTRTRDGRKVLHVHDSGLDVERPIAAWVEKIEFALTFRADGMYSHCADGTDLVHEPKMRKVRVVVYRTVDGAIRAFSDDEVGYFEPFSDKLRAEGRFLNLLEIEVPE